MTSSARLIPSAFAFDKAGTIVYYHCTKEISPQSKHAGTVNSGFFNGNPAITSLLSPIEGGEERI